MSVNKYGWGIQKSLFAYTNQDFIFSHTRDNSKLFNTTSKYFSFFNHKSLASWVAHIIRDFLTCYSCSYYSSMLLVILTEKKWFERFTKKNWKKKKKKKKFRVKKVIKRKGDILYVKWQRYDSSFNSWIDKKEKT